MCHAVQALGRYNTKAIEGSERIEEDFAALKGRLDMEKPLIFHVNLDVRQPHSWKMPYKDIKVLLPHLLSCAFLNQLDPVICLQGPQTCWHIAEPVKTLFVQADTDRVTGINLMSAVHRLGHLQPHREHLAT